MSPVTRARARPGRRAPVEKKTFLLRSATCMMVSDEAEEISPNNKTAPSCSIIEPIVFCTSVVSGTFSCSTTVMPGIFLRAAAAWACAWL